MMGDHSFQSFFCLCSIIKEIPEVNPQKEENDEPSNPVFLDIFYKPTSENAEFSESIWNENLDENIFNYIRNSEVFADAKEKEYLKVKIYLDETQ